MHKKLIIAFALCLPVIAVHAQPSAAKKPLVARVLKLQQPGIDAMARAMAERPALAVIDRADQVIGTSVAADKREAVGKLIQADVKKYLDETVPFVRDRAIKLAPGTIGTVLEEKFSEAELKQLADFLESPVYNKYQQMGGDMQKALLEKLLADTKGTVEPKITALDQTVAKRLGITVPAAGVAPAK
ncbi:MAG: hypothetical protein V4614_02725 [Pseudomonadota bacterium]